MEELIPWLNDVGAHKSVILLAYPSWLQDDGCRFRYYVHIKSGEREREPSDLVFILSGKEKHCLHPQQKFSFLL